MLRIMGTPKSGEIVPCLKTIESAWRYGFTGLCHYDAIYACLLAGI